MGGKTMRFLHIFDTAGVGAILSKELVKLGHQSTVLQMRQLDPFHIGDFYGNTTFFETQDEVVQAARKMDADVKIVHDYAIHADKFPGSKIFYHGSMLRHVYADKEKYEKGHTILVDQSHLLNIRPNAKLMPPTVDREHFSPRPIGVGRVNYILGRYFELMKAELPSDVKVVNRDLEHVDYKDFPNELAKFEQYVERRYDYSKPPKPIKDHSSTGLMALSMGMSLEKWGEKFTMFPDESDSRNTVKLFLQYVEPQKCNSEYPWLMDVLQCGKELDHLGKHEFKITWDNLNTEPL